MPTSPLEYQPWQRGFWSRRRRVDDLDQLNWREAHREALFQRDRDEFNQNAASRRALDLTREQAALDETSAVERHKRELARMKEAQELAKQREAIVRDRALQGLTQVEMENIERGYGGTFMPLNAPAMADRRARQLLSKADAASFLTDASQAEQTAGELPFVGDIASARGATAAERASAIARVSDLITQEILKMDSAERGARTAVAEETTKNPILGFAGALAAEAKTKADEAKTKNRRQLAKWLELDTEESAAEPTGSGRLGDKPQTRAAGQAPDVIDFNQPVDVRYGQGGRDTQLPTTPAPQHPNSQNITPAPFVPPGENGPPTTYEELLMRLMRRPQDMFVRPVQPTR